MIYIFILMRIVGYSSSPLKALRDSAEAGHCLVSAEDSSSKAMSPFVPEYSIQTLRNFNSSVHDIVSPLLTMLDV
jgi:hypothetical protein